MVLQSVGTYGALLASADPSSGVVGQMRIPGGGLLVVDLLRPDRHVQLELDPGNLDSVVGVQLRLLHDVGPIRPEDIDLPPEWVRTAVVDGVVRWSDLGLDEDLLRADRALALAELGDTVAAAQLYEKARTPLLRLARGRIGHEAVRAELRRVLSSAPEGYGITVPEPGQAAFEESEIGRLSRSHRWRPSARLASRGGDGAWGAGDTQEPGSDPDRIEILVDPLHVVSRLCVGVPSATWVDEGVAEVVWPANDHVVMSTPAARRLQVWAVDASTASDDRDASVLAIAPLALDGDDFRGRLRLPGPVPERLVIEPRDASVRTPPRVGPTGRAGVAALVALRDAADAQRLMAVAEALDDIASSASNDRTGALNAAGDALASIGCGLPDWVDRVAPPELRPMYADSNRPLLAELVAGADSAIPT